MKKQGVNITLVSIAVFVFIGIILVFFGAEVREAGLYVREQAQIEENRRLCEQESQALANGSDALTSEVWRFVATHNAVHMENYWREVHVDRSRDRALEALYTLSLTEEEQRLIESAKAASDGLVSGEAWAMRLVADSIGMSEEKMPPEVAAVRYTEGDERLSGEEKARLASQYIFGEEYSAVKEVIQGNIASFRQMLRERKSSELDAAMEKIQTSLARAHGLMLALILAFLAEAVLFYLSILRPFSSYTRALNRTDEDGFTALDPVGGRETRAFAAAFNHIYAEWQEKKARLEQERYRFHMALDNTSVIVYEYDVPRDIYTAYGTLEERDAEQTERVIPHFLECYAAGVMAPDALDQLKTRLRDEQDTPLEMRIRPREGDPHKIWIHLTGRPVYDGENRLVKFIGKISNIQSEKEKEFALEDARSRDGLTGLYKRETGIQKVRRFMESKSPDVICGMMLVDMDDFGQINESEGQAFADAVLQDVADILRAQTGPKDILVRLGGDEFMLFLKNCPKSRATVLGPEIARQIRGLSVQRDHELLISASIGMCVTEVVDEYSGLYRCAESTLKYVKEHGKRQAACYLDTSNELGMLLTQMYPEQHRINEIDRTEGAQEDLPSFALDLLGKAKNLNDAIFLLLSRVGRVNKLDRILIVEIDREYLGRRVVYQWAKRPSDQEGPEALYITQEQFQQLTAAYDADGLCDRRLITSPCQMASILHAAIWNYGNCVGAMSFETRQPHEWTAEERRLLIELTQVISSFTLKARADAVSQAKTDFLSRMSHEIRTPMNAITGMTIIAKSALNEPERLLDCLNKIDSANKYLLSLINDVLDMSRIESGKVELHIDAFSLKGLARNIETLIRPQAEAKRQRFVLQNGCTDGRLVLGDELRLNQVLVNLLGNAVKFTGEDGTVTLSIEAEGSLLKFSVSDTGIGISKQAQSRIFNAFEQADSNTSVSYGGTGLGLAISGRLVQLMGGSLEVESAPGKGSRFYFAIPLRYASGQKAREAAGEERGIPFDPAGKRLLIAEDNALNQEIAQEILEMRGFQVETANNGREAVDRFQAAEPGYYDAILMDIRMPVMDGMEATRRIRTLGKADSRTIPIIAMTANAFDEDMKKSLENSMDGHLSKPVDVEELYRTLDKLISRRK